jgi:hypothetical protein
MGIKRGERPRGGRGCVNDLPGTFKHTFCKNSIKHEKSAPFLRNFCNTYIQFYKTASGFSILSKI